MLGFGNISGWITTARNIGDTLCLGYSCKWNNSHLPTMQMALTKYAFNELITIWFGLSAVSYLYSTFILNLVFYIISKSNVYINMLISKCKILCLFQIIFLFLLKLNDVRERGCDLKLSHLVSNPSYTAFVLHNLGQSVKGLSFRV